MSQPKTGDAIEWVIRHWPVVTTIISVIIMGATYNTRLENIEKKLDTALAKQELVDQKQDNKAGSLETSINQIIVGQEKIKTLLDERLPAKR